MNWTDLPTGVFTGIDWAAPDATKGFDPYLVWAEADQFSGYGGAPPEWIPVIIQLHDSVTIQDLLAAASVTWLEVPPVYTSAATPPAFHFCTGRAKPPFFQHLRPGGQLQSLVKRVEMGLPAGPHAKHPSETADSVPLLLPETEQTARQAAEPAQLLTGKVIGLIDDSLALANNRFLHNGKARTRYFWRQDNEGRGQVPFGLGYGRELIASEIDQAMGLHTYNGLVDETAVYVALGLSTLGTAIPPSTQQPERKRFCTLDTAVSHGSHVTDLMAGPRTLLAQVAGAPPDLDAPPSWAQVDDEASCAPIVAVQLDANTVADTSGGSMNVHVLDGLIYILSRCAPDAQVAVNLSWGTLAGPHDGTSVLEAAMDELMVLRGARLQIMVAAGNSYQMRTHANVMLQNNEHITLYWRGLPGDLTQNFLEFWIEEGADGICFEITPPGHAAPITPVLGFGQSRIWTGSGTQPLCALIYPEKAATGERGTCALLAVAPSFSFKPSVATAPSGVWKIKLTNQGEACAIIDADVERDDVVGGSHKGATRQSHFEDNPQLDFNEQYDMQALVDDPARSTPIRRSGNFNSIATGSKTLSVGGVRIAPTAPHLRWAHYSPQKPDPDASRPSRPGVVKVPDTEAYSDNNPALSGVRAAGTRSDAVVRLAGTSAATPQVTRRILNTM
jgi:hypothetical protein